MAEAKTTPPAPAPDAAEAPVERASAELKAGVDESAPEPTKENTKQNANGAEEKPAESTPVQEDKKGSSAAEKPDTSAETADAKKSDEGAAAPAESEPTAAPAANGTPSSVKKSSSKRKSTGGDTKSKLNRKKSQSRITHLDAKAGEYYLARLRSFPPWPAIICDEDILPQSLLTTRPVTAYREDGTYREDYADGGKRVAERTFPIMFLQTNEFAWIPNTDLTPLDPESCKEVSEKGKSKSLIAAYGVAAEGHDLAHFKDLLTDHERAIQQEEEEREAQAAAKAAAKSERDAKKNKRKSMDVHDDVDMEDADEEPKQPKSSKKRKKDTEAEGDAKPAKTPKTATKLKLTTPKTPSGETGKKASGSSKTKQTASSKKGKAAASDESDESRPVSKEPEPRVNLEEAKKKRLREVLFVRHRLQKGFISRDQPPKEDEMSQMSSYLTKLEKIEDLEVSIIRETKIHKVLRMIIKLPSIPRDEEFQFRKRALDILSKWKNVLDSDRATPAQDKEEKPNSNGVHKEGSVETPTKSPKGEKEETKPETPDEDEAMPDVDSTEAEKEKVEETPAPAKGEVEKESEPADETAEKEKEKGKSTEKAEEKTAEAAA
ncbi:hypothetical protein BDW59DRAFT_85208 [Aspergillus cavernicola]|uniref:PWWP domain-containing protein n=1 Tax=Aspergillus cavernicola TaxID=176166 RepID=A0ABR4I9P2_9EURO